MIAVHKCWDMLKPLLIFLGHTSRSLICKDYRFFFMNMFIIASSYLYRRNYRTRNSDPGIKVFVLIVCERNFERCVVQTRVICHWNTTREARLCGWKDGKSKEVGCFFKPTLCWSIGIYDMIQRPLLSAKQNACRYPGILLLGSG